MCSGQSLPVSIAGARRSSTASSRRDGEGGEGIADTLNYRSTIKPQRGVGNFIVAISVRAHELAYTRAQPHVRFIYYARIIVR